MNIVTTRLLIRPVEKTDAAAILKAMECSQVHEMHSYGFTTINKVKSYIDILLREYQSDKYRTLAIAAKDSKNLIGLITVDVYKIFSRAEISYWIDKNNRNMGYATETVKAIIEYYFDYLSINRIQAMTSNPASEKVLLKAGMILEGTLRQYFGINNSFLDCRIYSILYNEFKPI